MVAPTFTQLPQDDVGNARRVATDQYNYFPGERLEHAVMQDERVRLARELHDGVLQSLTGASLQLRGLSRLIDDNPKAAHKKLRDIEDLVIEEQQELRTFIQKLSPGTSVSMAS